MSNNARNYDKERNRAKLRADGSFPSLLLWGAAGLLALGGAGFVFSILGSIK